MNVRVDFIAGHALQAQAAASVYEGLKGRLDCHWHIGRPSKPTGATAAVFMDHIHHHPEFARWPKRFYLLHDLGDIDVYIKERAALRQFTVVVVPDELHATEARRHLSPRWWRRGTDIFVGGWPKYDQLTIPDKFNSVTAELRKLPAQPTILYAPTWAGKEEWRTLLPLLAALPVNVVIKNHPYATTPGQEITAFYQRSKQSVAAMEQAAHEFPQPILVVPAELNICSIFPHVDAVISDQSSVVAEFLPWGVSIETGANPDGEAAPGISRVYPAVQYRPLDSLVADGGQWLLQQIAAKKPHTGPPVGAGKIIADMIWEKLCN